MRSCTYLICVYKLRDSEVETELICKLIHSVWEKTQSCRGAPASCGHPGCAAELQGALCARVRGRWGRFALCSAKLGASLCNKKLLQYVKNLKISNIENHEEHCPSAVFSNLPPYPQSQRKLCQVLCDGGAWCDL